MVAKDEAKPPLVDLGRSYVSLRTWTDYTRPDLIVIETAAGLGPGRQTHGPGREGNGTSAGVGPGGIAGEGYWMTWHRLSGSNPM